jgi:hypothetical protein
MFDFKCDPEMAKICINSNKCDLCDGKSLFRKPKWMIAKERREEKKRLKVPKKKKEGMSFEKSVASKINDVRNPKSKSNVARRRPNSGAIWNIPGDIYTKEELIECKERGSKNSRGQSQITIQKVQLSKIQQEALLVNKKPYYIFSFKEDPEYYVVKTFEDELKC